MKTIELSTAKKALSEYARELGDEIVVLTENNKPVVALVPLKDVDMESVTLSMDPQFRAIVEEARKDFAAGRKLSLEEMRREVLP
ncbi:MAG: type II toxin-antitoxin system Phd/YefM family antitoxin [Planctomycetota bacterium]|nr:type II toxin-antitoxin system Phd/YefM family antitoxin [Planctomycetota bacterium]